MSTCDGRGSGGGLPFIESRLILCDLCEYTDADLVGNVGVNSVSVGLTQNISDGGRDPAIDGCVDICEIVEVVFARFKRVLFPLPISRGVDSIGAVALLDIRLNG
jgi:hypothetical protein